GDNRMKKIEYELFIDYFSISTV
ncbi:uncharacterized protein METZ01_LOCUS167878, partial [marine metagenome]